MQTATSIAFAKGLPRLQELLGSTKLAREEARARVTPPLYQARNVGDVWVVSEIATGEVVGHAYQHETALVFVSAMEACAAGKRSLL